VTTVGWQVTSSHLERVRRIKNRLVRLTTRVETVREVS
jgi:magnesium transporter